jgi:site-specific DNA recombinase
MTNVAPTSLTRRKRARLRAAATELMPQRVCFYCRVSTDEQADQNTVQLQLDYLRSRYKADFEGHGPVPMVFVGELIDAGWSGAIPFSDRPDGARALEWAREGKFDVLAVYKVDRLGRTARVLLEAHADLENLDVALTSATEPFDTRPGPMQAFGRFVFQLLGSIAEFERSTIQARTMGGKLRVAKDGQFVNGQVPFGFTVNASGLLVPNRAVIPELGIPESDLVAQLFERIAAGESCYGLAEWLTDNGVVSPRRWFNKEHQRLVEADRDDTQQWTNRRVWETIRNTAYKGERNLSFDQVEHQQTIEEPIVTPALWDDANDRMKRNSRNPWPDRRGGYVYLLSRKIRCQATLPSGLPCNLLYTGGINNGYRYYLCNGTDKTQARRRGGNRCPARGIRVEKIEAVVWADLAWQIRNPELALSSTQALLRDRQERTVDGEERRLALRKRRDELDLARRHLRALQSSGRRPFEEVEEDLANNAHALAQVGEQLMLAETAIETSEAIERRYADAVPLLARLRDQIDDIEASQDRKTMRTLIDELVSEIRVLDPRSGDPDLEVRYRFRADSSMANAGRFTNIMTIVVSGGTPETSMRQVI